MPAQRHAVGRAHHFRPAQQVGNLLEGAVHHGEAVRVAERLQNRLDEPERQDKAGDRGGGVQRSAHVEVYPGGQHGDQRGRGNGHPRDVIAVGGAEPVFHGVPVGPDRRYEFPVGGRGLVERLDDLNAVDILYRSIIEYLAQWRRSCPSPRPEPWRSAPRNPWSWPCSKTAPPGTWPAPEAPCASPARTGRRP